MSRTNCYKGRISNNKNVKETLSLLQKTKFWGFVDRFGEINLQGLSKEESGPRVSDKGIVLIIDETWKALPIQDDLPLGMLPEIHNIELKTGVKLYYLWDGQKEGYDAKLLKRINNADYTIA